MCALCGTVGGSRAACSGLFHGALQTSKRLRDVIFEVDCICIYIFFAWGITWQA